MARLGSVAAAPFVGSEFVSLYVGATRVPTVPGKPVIASASEDGGATIVILSPPTNNGGSAILYYEFDDDGSPATVSTIGAGTEPGTIEAEFLGVAVGSSLQVAAVNAVGEGPLSAPFTVTAT
jgi:hypothetical protein